MVLWARSFKAASTADELACTTLPCGLTSCAVDTLGLELLLSVHVKEYGTVPARCPL